MSAKAPTPEEIQRAARLIASVLQWVDKEHERHWHAVMEGEEEHLDPWPVHWPFPGNVLRQALRHLGEDPASPAPGDAWTTAEQQIDDEENPSEDGRR